MPPNTPRVRKRRGLIQADSTSSQGRGCTWGYSTLVSKIVPELDGIRGLAILSVIAFHATQSLPSSISVTALGLGWAGVDLFFVLSGFLITGILVDTKGRDHALVKFYIRRLLRIFPLYYLALLLVFRLAPILGHKSVPEEWWFWLYLANWSPSTGTAHAWLTHFWTLAIEEQFYIVWPLLVFWLSRREMMRISVGLAGACLAARAIGSYYLEPIVIYRNTLLRVDSLVVGAICALVVRDRELLKLAERWRRVLVAIAVAGIAVSIVLGGIGSYGRPMNTIGYTSLAVLFGNAVVWAATARRTRAHSILRSGALHMIGKHSYAMYVFHVPIIAVVLRCLRPWKLGIAAPLVQVASSLSLTFIVSILSWHLIEKPFLQLKSRFNY